MERVTVAERADHTATSESNMSIAKSYNTTRQKNALQVAQMITVVVFLGDTDGPSPFVSY